MSRLALSDTDKQARDWFVETTKSLGCSVTVDAMGNTFAVRPGRRNDVAPIFAGSHLDTQPAAGRYDGILGIQAGIEVSHYGHEETVLCNNSGRSIRATMQFEDGWHFRSEKS